MGFLQFNKSEMEQCFLDKTLTKVVQFEFGENVYEDTVNYAYLNASIDDILKTHNVDYLEKYTDQDMMCIDVLNAKNYNSYMNRIIKILYDLDKDILLSSEVVYDIVCLFNKICMLLDSGNRLSVDFSLLHVCDAIENNEKLRELMTTQHITEDMSMVEIDQLRKRLTKEFKEIEIEGLSDLINSGYGIKDAQMINIMIMRGLKLRIHYINEISPYVSMTKWLDGISEYDDLFVESNVNRKTVIITKEKMQEVGYKTKLYNIATQDTVINNLDCGTKVLLDITIKDKKDLLRYERKLYLNDKNELEEITSSHLDLIGKPIKIRSAFTCMEPTGICATCFGANAVWNISTSKYKKDPGIDAVKSTYSKEGQKTLSFKHMSNPTMIYPDFKIYDYGTGEETPLSIEHFFKIKRSTLIPKRKDIQILIKDEYMIKDIRRAIGHVDIEFGDYNNNRINNFIIKEKDKEYLVGNNSPFIVYGEQFEALKPPTLEGEVDISNNEIRYVVLNDSAVSTYVKLTELDTSKNENMTIDELVASMNDILHESSFLKIELISYRKIRSKENPRRRPNFNENEEYVIYSIQKVVNKLPSASLQMSINDVPSIIENPFFHDPDNIKPTTYDSLFFDSKEDLI